MTKETGRRSHLPGQLRPLYDQRMYEQPRTTLPSWNNTWETLLLRTHNKPGEKRLVREHRLLLREYYDARFKKETGSGDEDLKKFADKYSNETSEKIIERLTPYITFIRDSFPKQTPRK